MDYLQKLVQQVKIILLVALLADNILLFTIWYLSRQAWHLPFPVIMALLLFTGLLFTFLLAITIGNLITQPLKMLWKNILHVSPSEHSTTITKTGVLWLGRDLVTNLTNQVYQLANVVDTIEKTAAATAPDLHKNFVANSLPLPLIVLDSSQTITFANAAALKYLGKEAAEVFTQNVYSVMDMAFVSDQTFDMWLAKAKSDSATATQTWERVRLNRAEQSTLQFDLAAYYNKSNPEGIETMLILFDHTDRYTQDDQAVGFVALAVHELRTPITVLRGYIEALDEELSGKLGAEQLDFLHKMKASSQQLTAFVNNILNVARIEGDQLELELHEENWSDIIHSAIDNLSLRAEVRGIRLEAHIEDDIPTVGVDRFSIYEVISNLVDNAIKYNGDGQQIIITSKLKDGLVETTVQDRGVGIAASVIPTLFNKFQRNYHNKAQISGTGLGLYLCKAIITAHGGNIWVESTEGQGTLVGFTLQPFASLADGKKNGNNNGITRSAHGWIKNHSLYRR